VKETIPFLSLAQLKTLLLPLLPAGQRSFQLDEVTAESKAIILPLRQIHDYTIAAEKTLRDDLVPSPPITHNFTDNETEVQR
jgi:hypothetical protein